jgi:hypothetical protein
MNVFVVLGDRIVTPQLSGSFLPGVTRDSVITLLRGMGHDVVERRVVEARTVGPAVREKLVAIMNGREGDPCGWLEPI